MAHLLDARRDEFLALVAAEKCLGEICKIMGTTSSHTSRFAQKLGVKMRHGNGKTSAERAKPITAERVRELFLYDPLTGHLTWRTDKTYRALAGQRAGMVHKYGYRIVSVDCSKLKEHRLIWLHVTGEWPKGMIDHCNGDRADNPWANLREATPVINAQNRRKARAGARAGFLGVTVKPKCPNRPFLAAISIGGRRRELGYFATAEEAHASRRLHPLAPPPALVRAPHASQAFSTLRHGKQPGQHRGERAARPVPVLQSLGSHSLPSRCVLGVKNF